MGKIMRNGVSYGGSSSKSSSFAYNNSNTELSATNVQAAIDELTAMISAIENKRKGGNVNGTDNT